MRSCEPAIFSHSATLPSCAQQHTTAQHGPTPRRSAQRTGDSSRSAAAERTSSRVIKLHASGVTRDPRQQQAASPHARPAARAPHPSWSESSSANTSRSPATSSTSASLAREASGALATAGSAHRPVGPVCHRSSNGPGHPCDACRVPQLDTQPVDSEARQHPTALSLQRSAAGASYADMRTDARAPLRSLQRTLCEHFVTVAHNRYRGHNVPRYNAMGAGKGRRKGKGKGAATSAPQPQRCTIARCATAE